MRPVIDFLSGIVSGFGVQANRVKMSEFFVRTHGRRRTDSHIATWVDVIGRFVLLVACVSIGAAVIFATTGFSSRQKISSVTGASLTAPEQSMDEIVSVDPAVPRREWKYIVVHHSASFRGSAQIFDDWHHARGWARGLGYHFVIGNGTDQGDGVIAAGPRWYSQEPGAHANATEFNDHGIGICLVGNFEEQPPTPAQWAALHALVSRLCRQYNIPPSSILGHNQVRRGGSTACPGRLLPLEKLRESI